MSCGGIKKHNELITKLHVVEDLKRDVDAVYFQLKKHHPKLYQYTPKEVLDFKFDSLKSTLIVPITSREFYKKLAPVVAHVKQGHISIGSVAKRYTKKEIKELKKRKFEFNDLDFEYLDNKLWVVNTSGKDSTFIGKEVYKINDELATDLVKLFKTRFASDGYNKTLHNRVVGKYFNTLYSKDKGFSDSLKIEFKHKDSLYSKMYHRVIKDDKTKKTDSLAPVIPKKLTNEEKEKKRIVAKAKRKENRKRGFIASIKEYTRNFDFIGKDSTVAYMKIRSFDNGNYKKFYKESFKTLNTLKTKNLILDLRDNGGGRINETNYLYSYLTEHHYNLLEKSEVNNSLPVFKDLIGKENSIFQKASAIVFSPIIIAFDLLSTKKHEGKFYYNLGYSKKIKPKKLNYKNELFVLINGNSFSASSLISTHLKANKRAIFVGEETGGAYNGCVAGMYKIFEMPTSKLKIRMGLMQIEAPFKQNPDGFGIKPDVEILPTIENRKQNKDAELDWILNTIDTNIKS